MLFGDEDLKPENSQLKSKMKAKQQRLLQGCGSLAEVSHDCVKAKR